MIKPNPDKETYDKVTEAVKKNDGYCPCIIEKTESSKCICEDFVAKSAMGYKGKCRCGRYIND